MTIHRRQSIRVNLELRARIFSAVRAFFTNCGFLEVETPVRIPAPAPEPFITPYTSGSWFLHTSPELCMKRLLAAGYEKIFTICKCFRKEERGKRHLSEFTMLEWYKTGTDYCELMNQCEDLLLYIAENTIGSATISYRNNQIDLKKPWPRLTVSEAYERFTGKTMKAALADDSFDERMADAIEPFLGNERPVFLIDYPAERCPLAATKKEAPELSERFELYVGGLELCNGFTELRDEKEQEERFRIELARRKQANEKMTPMPAQFLKELHHMPSAAGNAMGLDRLVMLMADTEMIDDVVAFIPEELQPEFSWSRK